MVVLVEVAVASTAGGLITETDLIFHRSDSRLYGREWKDGWDGAPERAGRARAAQQQLNSAVT